MVDVLMLGFAFVVLAAAGVLWGWSRERELQFELRNELLRRLERRSADASVLVEELRRSGSLRAPRLFAVLEAMRLDGALSSAWGAGADGRPRRMYFVPGARSGGTDCPSVPAPAFPGVD